MSSRIWVAITGASGSLYALRLIEVLLAAGGQVDVIVSKAAQLVFATETPLALPGNPAAQATFLQQYFLGFRLRPAWPAGDLSVLHGYVVSHCYRCQ